MESSEWSTNSKSSKLSASLCGLCGFSPPFNLIASAMSTDSRRPVANPIDRAEDFSLEGMVTI